MDNLRPQCLSSKDYILLKKFASDDGKGSVNSLRDIKDGGVFEELWFSNVFRWTLILPLASVGIGYAVLKLRDTYCHLVIPKY